MNKRLLSCISVIILIFFATVIKAEVAVKVRDISFIDGLKENQIFGYGLVVGLQGTGDSKSSLTRSSLNNLLKNLGMEGEDISSKNCAAVMLTAELPAFSHVGDRIDITVSSIGDAKSLAGGILVQSPLRGADDVIYAVAQGPLSVTERQGARRNVKTVALISNGGVIERELKPEIAVNDRITIVLKNWDYAAADAIIKAIESKYPDSKPQMTDDAKISAGVDKNIILPEFISSIENLEITPETRAVVVINERDGTIVAGGNVRISQSMVSKEGLIIEIEGGARKGSAALIKDTAQVSDLVEALNSIGASTSDIISILKALKEAGSLHAELIVR